MTDLLDGVFNIKLQENGIEKMFRLGRWSPLSRKKSIPAGYFQIIGNEKYYHVKSQKPQESNREVQRCGNFPWSEKTSERWLKKLSKLILTNESEDVKNYRFLARGRQGKSPKSNKDQKKQFFCPGITSVSTGANITCLQARTCWEIRNPCLKIRKSVLEILTMFYHCCDIRASLCNVKSMLILTISLFRHALLRS